MGQTLSQTISKMDFLNLKNETIFDKCLLVCSYSVVFNYINIYIFCTHVEYQNKLYWYLLLRNFILILILLLLLILLLFFILSILLRSLPGIICTAGGWVVFRFKGEYRPTKRAVGRKWRCKWRWCWIFSFMTLWQHRRAGIDLYRFTTNGDFR